MRRRLLYQLTLLLSLLVGGASVWAATIKADTFVDTANVQLQSHVPTPSATGAWDTDTNTRLEIGASNNLRIDSETSHKAGRETTSIGSADMDVSLTCTLNGGIASAAHKCGPAGRIPDTENGLANSYQAWLIADGTLADLELVKVVASSTTSLGTYNLDGDPTVAVVLKLELRTAAKKLYADGTERISSVDDNLTSNTYAGVNGLRNAWTADDYLSESAAAAAARRLWLLNRLPNLVPSVEAADDRTVEWYSSTVCGDGTPELPRKPCAVTDFGLKNWVLQGETGGLMYLRVLDLPATHKGRTLAVRLRDVELPAAIQSGMAARGTSRIDGR